MEKECQGKAREIKQKEYLKTYKGKTVRPRRKAKKKSLNVAIRKKEFYQKGKLTKKMNR